ncbi:MAG TPA: beta-xylosidase [Phycisphaerae bacterium]|nr:beta-xylosidase [Phycisphaerae bacterium]
MQYVKLAFVAVLFAFMWSGPAFHAAWAEETAAIPVTILIDASRPKGQLTPIWRFFGYDECNYTYMKDGQKLLTEISRLEPHPIYIRCHHLFTSGDGSPALKWGSTNIYTEDTNGKPVYDFTIVDKIFDTYIQRGLKPYAQLGFMPKDLSTHPELYPKNIDPDKRISGDEGVAYPPKDYNKWRELARQWVLHCIQRYGKEEVNSWYWEVWNEPNISYWRGTREEYYKLYDYAVDGIRSALPTARVGGPETAGDARYTTRFLEHCAHGTNYATGKPGVPLDFISFHAKGNPKFVDGHVRMGIGDQLTVIDRNFAAIAAFPELKNIPIVIGESDPDGMAARLPTESPAVGYRNTTLFSSYTADCIAREYDIADDRGVNLEGALTWSFEFENKPYFPGFRVLSSNGIDHPVMNVFRMLSKMSGERLAVDSSAAIATREIASKGVRQQPDISALAATNEKEKAVTVLAWNYHDDDVAGPSAAVTLNLHHLPNSSGAATLTQYRIDETHSNAYTVWQKMGSPQNPTPDQYKELEQAGQLAAFGEPEQVRIEDGNASVQLTLPPHAVALLVFSLR